MPSAQGVSLKQSWEDCLIWAWSHKARLATSSKGQIAATRAWLSLAHPAGTRDEAYWAQFGSTAAADGTGGSGVR